MSGARRGHCAQRKRQIEDVVVGARSELPYVSQRHARRPRQRGGGARCSWIDRRGMHRDRPRCRRARIAQPHSAGPPPRCRDVLQRDPDGPDRRGRCTDGVCAPASRVTRELPKLSVAGSPPPPGELSCDLKKMCAEAPVRTPYEGNKLAIHTVASTNGVARAVDCPRPARQSLAQIANARASSFPHPPPIALAIASTSRMSTTPSMRRFAFSVG